MLAPMKKPTMEKYTEFCIRVPVQNATAIRELLESSGHVLDISERELYTAKDVFPDSHPGKIIKGLRVREGLTQQQLAEKTGLRHHHISEMEHGKRAIGKEMARRLGKALNADYKILL
jgi:ribosome-binding protein aMBF1 (putative translation factor)